MIGSDGVKRLNRLANFFPTSTTATKNVTSINDVAMKKLTSASYNNKARISTVIMYHTPKS